MRIIAIYPGRFDPVTNGHIALIRRAQRLFDRLIVAVFEQSSKAPLFSVDERVSFLRQALGEREHLSVEPFSGLLTDFAQARKASVIVRGLRATTDFAVEFDQALMYREMSPQLEQVYLMSDLNHIFVSASRIREVARLGYDVSKLVPEPVAKALLVRYPSS